MSIISKISYNNNHIKKPFSPEKGEEGIPPHQSSGIPLP